MASTQQLKGRIKSVKNTKQITKAMELVAASKMRRAQEVVLQSRDFRNAALGILTRLRELTDVKEHPLFVHRHIKTRLHVVVTSDRGLAGAYNSNLLKKVARELQADRKEFIESQLLIIGKQGSKFMTRFKGIEIIGVYHNFPDHPNPNDIRPILNTILDKYKSRTVDAVDIYYTDFKSTINQIVALQRLLPAAFESINAPVDLERAIFEPSVDAVLNTVTERLIEAQLTQAILESQASEHSMRMLAMKNATDNAKELIDDLTLAFNTARQAAITQELAEITGGAEAIN